MTTSTLTKADLIRQIADQTGRHQNVVGSVLQALGDAIVDHTAVGVTVITPFGRFVPKARAARTGRNPRTGEALQIAASATVSFKMAKAKS